ncbi:MAG: TrkH family potassium uptake protein [Myxococcota bacterium]
MNARTIFWLAGLVLGSLSLAQVPSLVMAWWLGEPWLPFVLSIALGALISASLIIPMRRGTLGLNHRSAFIAVTTSWGVACAFGALIYWDHPSVALHPIDALFESASGFTATGATILSGLDRLPRSLLLWRSITQWLGGMGFVLLGIAVFPLLGLGGMQLYKAETPGPTKDKLTPRIAETAKILWTLYLGLTVASAGLYYLGGMSLFDAICHAMTTVATGGFSTHDLSFGFWDSGFIHLTATVFMMLGGTSFVVLHRSLTQGVPWGTHPELRVYFGLFVVLSLLMAINLRVQMGEQFGNTAEALEHAAFQVASIMTTSGFVTMDFDLWPPFCHALLLALFLCGGMAGSTSGGIKVVRLLVMVRVAFAQFFNLVHPRGYGAIKLGERTVEQDVIRAILGFIAMWLLLLGIGTALIATFGSDLDTSLTAAAACLGNIGPGFGEVGPSNTYLPFAGPAKLVMISLMVLGRLEIYTALVILTPVFWRR